MRQSSMRVRMLFFGQLKEAAGRAEQSLEMVEGASVRDLLDVLRGTLPAEVLEVSAVAVNREYAAFSRVLRDGDEVAILPPVSGGWA
jgi:molybdopterin converting factor subunit 1